ncbi:MAG: O-antigen ligase family protein [Solirubrobacteraceae bacterium]|nr:MAG: hypothetical protein DLM63_08425 [Solirubrobacterales bacterium]
MSSVAYGASPRRVGALALPRSQAGFGALLGLALGAGLTATAFIANGGLQLRPITLVEMSVTAVGGALCAGAIVASPRRPLYGASSLVLFAVLAVLTGLSLTWSLSPDDSWLEVSRTLSYVAAFAGAVALVRLAPRRWASVVGGVLIATMIVSLYALASKVFPDALSPNATFARLRDPFGYWNAVGLMAALGAPGCLWLGSRREGHPAVNALAPAILCALLVCMLLAYSRGSLLAIGLGVALWFIFVPLRLRGFVVLVLAVAGAVGVSAWTFAQHNLVTDNVALPDRVSSGHQFGVLLGVVLVALIAAGFGAGFARAAWPLPARTRRRAGITILVALALLPVAGLAALAASQRGIGGTISHTWHQLTADTVSGPANSPGRLTAASSVRSRYFREAAAILARHPWLGTGAGSFATARLRLRKSPLFVQHAHSYVMQTLADLGITGMAVSLALLAAWLAACRRTIGRRWPQLDPAVDAERCGLLTLLAVVVTFGVHSAVDWTWIIPGTALPALVAAGWVAGRGPLLNGRPSSGSLWRTTALRVAAATLALVVSGAAVWEIWQPLRSSDAGNGALTALAHGHTATARQLALQAAGRDPFAADPWFTLAVIDQSAGSLNAAEADLRSAVSSAPATPAPWERLADFELHQRQDPTSGFVAARVALYLDPLSAQAVGYFLEGLRRTTAPAAATTAAPPATTPTPTTPTIPSTTRALPSTGAPTTLHP